MSVQPQTGPRVAASRAALLDVSVDEGPRPKHAQLTELLTELATSELSPGEAMPSERELMAAYSLSRATVRRSVDGLVADGVLERVHGKATFVARPRLDSRLHLASFSQDMRRRGRTPSTRLLGLDADRPPAEVASTLGLRRGALAWRLRRLRLADGRPVALEDGWYPRARLAGLDRHDLSGSLYALLDTEYGLRIDGAEQTLWGEAADARTARLLVAPPHTPLLVFRRVSYAGDVAVERVVSRYRGDRYELHMSLGASADAPPAEGNRR